MYFTFVYSVIHSYVPLPKVSAMIMLYPIKCIGKDIAVVQDDNVIVKMHF